MKYFVIVAFCLAGIMHLQETAAKERPVCIKEKQIPNCKPPPPEKDPFDSSVNRDAVEVVKTILTFNRDIRANNKTYIAEQASIGSNFTGFLRLADSVSDTFWKKNCKVSNAYRNFLVNDYVMASRRQIESVCTFERLSVTLYCMSDCNFDQFFKTRPNLNSTIGRQLNDTNRFAKRLLSMMNPKVLKSCKDTIAKDIPKPQNPREVINDLDSINFIPQKTLANFSANDTLNIAKALGSSGQKLDKEKARQLGKKIPKDADAGDMLSLASSIPLDCFKNTSVDKLVANFSSMDVENMDKSRKAFIAKKIMDSGNKRQIEEFMKKNTDKTMMGTISTKVIEQLNIDISTIPAKNIPKAYLKKYAKKMLSNVSLESITDIDKLGKIVAGIKKSDIKKIPKENVIATVVNMVNASITSERLISSKMRQHMRNLLKKQLIEQTQSELPATYLAALTSQQVQVLYPIFIEAPKEMLAAFATLTTFSSLVAEAVKMPQQHCCDYIRASRALFTEYALPTITTNEIPTYSNIVELGSCLASTIGSTLLSKMNSSDVISYFPNAGASYQPDSAEIAALKTKITEVEASYSDKEDFVFQTLKDLAIFYPKYSTLNSTKLKESGSSLIESFKTTKDTKNPEIQMCRLGLASSELDNLAKDISSKFVTAYLSSLGGSKRRKRSASALTCAELNDLSSSLNSIPVNTLSTISVSEFTDCMSLLGSSSNYWSSDQLSALVSIAKTKYSNNIGSIPDADIASLNSILQGFSASELAQLVFTSTSSISTLGALSGWTEAQLTNGLGPATQTYLTNYRSGSIDSSDISTLGNLACGLSSTNTDNINDSNFVDSVPTLSVITSTCPNMGVWYAKAVASPTYGPLIYNSTEKIAELGTILAGITTSDLALMSPDDVSSLVDGVWTIMPPATVNTLSVAQIEGLTSVQLNSIQNSPNYASFSTVVKSATASLSSGSQTAVVSTTDSFSAGLRYDRALMLISTVATILATRF